jgi:hypothetical protein
VADGVMRSRVLLRARDVLLVSTVGSHREVMP